MIRIPLQILMPLVTLSVAIGLFVVGLSHASRDQQPPEPEIQTVTVVPSALRTASAAAVREIPKRFPRDTHMPDIKESSASGSIDLESFSAGRDLTYVADKHVWWESDNDSGDTECDHTMHHNMVKPVRRLIALVNERGGRLRIQDTFRPSAVHNDRSLHKEGRAIDVTCKEMSLEELAKLAWAAGFDWVYHEASAKGGAHVHCSVKR